MSNVFFTSDTHFGHAAILMYQKRPFPSLEAHDAALIENWNAVVQPGDTVYHLGDVAFYRERAQVERLLRVLHGNKFCLIGNHDRDAVTKAEGWAWVGHWKEIRVMLPAAGVEQRIILYHYPQVTWKGQHRGSWALHGHCHGNLKRDRLGSWASARTFDAGADCWGFRPISLAEVETEFAKPTYGFTPVDHHGAHDKEAE